MDKTYIKISNPVEQHYFVLETVLRSVILNIVNWALSDKTEDQTFGEYFLTKEINIKKEKFKLEMNLNQVKQLHSNKNGESFDIALLHKLVTKIIFSKKYRNVFNINDDENTKKITNAVSDVQNWRNKLSHQRLADRSNI